MTIQQFEKGYDLYQEIRSLKTCIDEYEKVQSRNVVHLDVKYPHYIGEAIFNDLKNIEKEHSVIIVNEALACLREHLVRLENDLAQV